MTKFNVYIWCGMCESHIGINLNWIVIQTVKVTILKQGSVNKTFLDLDMISCVSSTKMISRTAHKTIPIKL